MIRGPPRTTRTATLCPSTTLFRSAPDRPGRTAIRPLPPVPTTVDRPAPAGWRLVWSDEFDGSAVDTSVWKPYHSTYGDGNRELQCLTPGNVTASGGQLDRKSVVQGTSVSVRVDLGGRRIIKKKIKQPQTTNIQKSRKKET